jgi:thymidylate kinase
MGTRSPGIYAIIGLDGAGKTTVALRLCERLERSGQRTAMVWLRSPRFFSLPILGILRLIGYSRTVRLGGHDDVHTDLTRHPRLFHLMAWLLTFDYVLAYYLKIRLRRRLGRAVILDRFVWDALVDLILSQGRGLAFLEDPEGRILLDIGLRHPALLLRAPTPVLLARKPILSLDPKLEERVRTYEELAARYSIGTATSDEGQEEATTAVVGAYFGIR